MKRYYCFIVLITLSITSCKKYLDEKSDKTVAVPSTLQDMRALLNNQFQLNSGFTELSEIAADDYYVTSTDWSSLSSEDDRNNYHWLPEAEDISSWLNPYETVMYANTVLHNLEKIELNASNKIEWESCKGEALFFRAFAFFDIAQVYCPPYDPNTGNAALGIPLRLSADFTVPTTRSSVEQTYQRITNDLIEATSLLPVTVPVKTRPSKAAAFAALARVFLSMEEYGKALQAANEALNLSNGLIDYNTVNATSTAPFTVFNTEVIFHAVSPGSGLLNMSISKIDSTLYASYTANDLRKTVFFRNNNNGTYGFKGSYNAVTNNNFFNGLATDELYLIKAECLARNGNIPEAMNSLNALLINRWKTGTFSALNAQSTEQAIRLVLTERRKQLLFRSLRWQDLRRLNRDTRFAITLKRVINGQSYLLPPADLRYVMQIPRQVIELTGLPQNPR